MEQILPACAWHTGSTGFLKQMNKSVTSLAEAALRGGWCSWAGPLCMAGWDAGPAAATSQGRSAARATHTRGDDAGDAAQQPALLHTPHVSMTACKLGHLLKHKIRRRESVVGFSPTLRQQVLQTKLEKENENEMLAHLCSHPGSLPSYSGSTFQWAVCSTALQTRCINPHAELCTGTSSWHHRHPSSPSQVERVLESCMGDGSTCRGQRTVKLHYEWTISIFPPAPTPSPEHRITLCLVPPHPIPASHQGSKHRGSMSWRGQKPTLTALWPFFLCPR